MFNDVEPETKSTMEMETRAWKAFINRTKEKSNTVKCK